MNSMQLEIVTAERLVYSDDVNGVVAPGVDGELGILPYHAPLLTALQPGELRILQEGSEDILLAIGGGFLEVMANKIVVLADVAEYSGEINEERAQEAVRRAQERLSHPASEMDIQRAIASLRRAETRLKVTRRRSQRRSSSI